MKFPSLSFAVDLPNTLQPFEGRTYVDNAEFNLNGNQMNVLGQAMHRAGYFKANVKYAGKPHRVWCLDRAIATIDTDKVRSELKSHGVT